MGTMGAYGWSTNEVESHGYLVPAILDLLKGTGARKVMDLGCGNGAITAQLSRAGYEVLGVEPSDDGIAAARLSYPTVSFAQGSAYDNLKDLYGEFDAIVSAEVVEHLYSPHKLIENCYSALSTGGTLVLTTPYHGYLKNLAISVVDGWDKHFTALHEHMHIKFWSKATLTTLLENGGFPDQDWRLVGRVPFLAKSMISISRKP